MARQSYSWEENPRRRRRSVWWWIVLLPVILLLVAGAAAAVFFLSMRAEFSGMEDQFDLSRHEKMESASLI